MIDVGSHVMIQMFWHVSGQNTSLHQGKLQQPCCCNPWHALVPTINTSKLAHWGDRQGALWGVSLVRNSGWCHSRGTCVNVWGATYHNSVLVETWSDLPQHWHRRRSSSKLLWWLLVLCDPSLTIAPNERTYSVLKRGGPSGSSHGNPLQSSLICFIDLIIN